MKSVSTIAAALLTGATLLSPYSTAIAAGSKEARVTQIIREVKLLPADAASRAAALNDKVSEDTGVRTGGESRSELTFPDLTITRLGANTIFSFNKAGRTANVESGSILLRVPKDSGGGTIRSSAVTVAITGTTVIFEGSRGARNKLYTLEGSARVALKSKPSDWRKVAAGQMLDVPPGATTLPMPVNFDVNELMRSHPLITDFKPLPSAPLIMAVAQQPPPPVYTGPSISVNVPGVIDIGPRGPRRPNQPPTTNQPPGTKPPSRTDQSPESQPPGTDNPTGPKGPKRPPGTKGPITTNPPSTTTTTTPTPTAGPILRKAPVPTTKPVNTPTPSRVIRKKSPPSGPR